MIKTIVITLLAASAVLAAEKPNIIVIMADDLGYGDVGFTGGTEFKTPHLDALAQAGAICTSGYANHAFCAPTRAALMSGRYQQRFGFETNPAYSPRDPKAGLPLSEKTIASRLKEVGYTTGIIGKWHLGAHKDHHPLNRGFDHFFGFLEGGHDYFKVDSRETAEPYLYPLVRNEEYANVDGYLTHQLTDDAIGFIEKNKEKPFFLYLAYNAPHAPCQAPRETIAALKHIQNPERRAYAAMIVEMDRDIGRVVESLQKNGLAEKTLLFFLSDNGGDRVEHGVANNGPFRGKKGDVHEGGMHVPFTVTWPGTIPAGATYAKPVLSFDITATAAAVAGADASGFEGKNLIPFLKGEQNGVPHEYIFFRQRDNAIWAVIDHNGNKLLRPKWDSENLELYRLGSDAGEQDNLFTQLPEEAQRLKAAYDAWNAGNIRYRFLDFWDWEQKIDEWNAAQRNFDSPNGSK